MIFKNFHIRVFYISIILLILNISLSLFAEEKNDSDKIKTLEKIIQNFEENFYKTGELDSNQFNHAIERLNNVIGEYILLAEQTSDRIYYERAFSHLEKSKNLKILHMLYAAMKNDSVKTSWQALLYNNFQLCKKFETMKTNFTFSSTKNDTMLSQLIELKKSIQTAIFSANIYNPKLSYFLQLQKPIVVKEVQNYFRGHDEALLDFWISGDRIAIFIVTPDTFLVNHRTIPAEIVKRQIHELISPLYYQQDLTDLKFNCSLAFQLYEKLFKPVEKSLQSIKTIVIIPDNYLLSFPFEVLVTDSVTKARDKEKKLYQHFRDVNFLIKKYAILYNYSTTALNPGLREAHSEKKLGRRLLTMSEPEPSLDWNNPTNQILKKFNPAFFETSKFSADEIKRVSRLLWRHDNLKGTEATKRYLFDKGSNYRWLYLTQPSLLSNSSPFYSGALFSKSMADSLHTSQWLSVNEVLGLNLRADMLTLSNCRLEEPFSNNTKGIMALPESFLFSGVRSVVFSIWNAEYIGTSQFMSKFYWELKYKRQWNVTSLQSAKIASMKDTFHHGEEVISRAHPYFWANFRLIGNPYVSSPSNAKIRPWGVVLIVYFFVIVIVFIITKKTLVKVTKSKS